MVVLGSAKQKLKHIKKYFPVMHEKETGIWICQ